MSATIAVDILAGAFNLSSAQERVLRESQGYVRGGTKVNAATRRVLVRLGLIESTGRGYVTTAWGDAIGEELVAREAAKDEYLPEIIWDGGYGWIADRFKVILHAPESYGLDDSQGRYGSTFKTLVHLRQFVREVLAEEQREMDELMKASNVIESSNGWAELHNEHGTWVDPTGRWRFVPAGPRSYFLIDNGQRVDKFEVLADARKYAHEHQEVPVPHQPTIESDFLLLVAEQTPIVSGIKIIKVGKFSPGGDGVYACAWAIGYRSHRLPEHAFSTHRLIWNDERRAWSLDSGDYDLDWAKAVQELDRRN